MATHYLRTKYNCGKYDEIEEAAYCEKLVQRCKVQLAATVRYT